MENPAESQIMRIKQYTPREAIKRFLSNESNSKLEKVSENWIYVELPKFRDEFFKTEEGKLWYENYVGEREESHSKSQHSQALKFKLQGEDVKGGY